MCHTWHFGSQLEDPDQVDSDSTNMEESIMTKKNMFNNMCRTIIKTPASKEVRFVIMRTISRCSVTNNKKAKLANKIWLNLHIAIKNEK